MQSLPTPERRLHAPIRNPQSSRRTKPPHAAIDRSTSEKPTTKVDHNAGSLPAAEHRVELVQGVMASRFIDVGVDLLRGRGGGAFE